ncbi:MAG: DNA-directed RNA polymerase subunit omega [Oscillospiraceae bacterium]|nr:DNA-directed RNA polymerase subunit omega [Oscillospiraceae bacterium]
MMLYPTMPELLKNIESRYMLVNVIAKRAREIAQEAEDEGEQLNEKPVSLAVKEIAEGKVKAQAVSAAE